MADALGVPAKVALPTNQTELLQLIVLELRTIQHYLKEGFSSADEPYRVRDDIAKAQDITIS